MAKVAANRFNRKNGKGFTLIELLVVIAIIGLLASIVLVSLNSSRKKARDTRRKTDISQIITALALYYDIHSDYPTISYGGNCGTAIDGNDAVSTALKNDGFLSTMPSVPSNTGTTCGASYYAGSFLSNACGPAGIAVLTDLENADSDCLAWSCGWYKSGSYCSPKRFLQVLYK